MVTTVVDDNAQTHGQIRQVFIQPYCPILHLLQSQRQK